MYEEECWGLAMTEISLKAQRLAWLIASSFRCRLIKLKSPNAVRICVPSRLNEGPRCTDKKYAVGILPK